MLNWMVRSFTDFESSLTSVERIKEYVELEPEVILTFYLKKNFYEHII